jgi:hypothetical protein
MVLLIHQALDRCLVTGKYIYASALLCKWVGKRYLSNKNQKSSWLAITNVAIQSRNKFLRLIFLRKETGCKKA